nr:envelope protein 2 variant 644 [Hepacivirus hominis]MOZ58588.1 envelope protein 2 variant 793 [Hepacivirus hominis]
TTHITGARAGSTIQRFTGLFLPGAQQK